MTPQTREKRRLYSQEYWRAHPEKRKEYSKTRAAKVKALKYQSYGISIEEYEGALILANGQCELCKINPGEGRLVVDHNHKTGEYRGLLCTPCNTALGLLRDSPELLRKAAEYLENSK